MEIVRYSYIWPLYSDCEVRDVNGYILEIITQEIYFNLYSNWFIESYKYLTEQLLLKEDFKKVKRQNVKLELIKKTNKAKTLKRSITKRYKSLYELIREVDELEKAKEFISDYLSLRFIRKNTGLTALDIMSVIVSMSNLLRYAYLNNIDEVYLGSLRFKRLKNYFVLVEY